MKQGINRAVAAGSLVCALMLGSAGHAAYAIPVDQDFGSASEEQNAERVIKIAPDAKWVNVTEGETVKFIDEASAKSFVWRFDTIVAVFDLNRVAPAEMLAGHQVKAYVATSYRRQHNS
jgi:hypothetical protein